MLGNRALPTKRTALGRALAEWRSALVADLGGEGHVSTQQLALVDVAVRTKLMLDSVDAYVLGLDALVNKRKRCLWPVVRERQALAGQLQGVLRDLGLERRQREADVATLLARLHENKDPGVLSAESAESPPAGQDRQGSQDRQENQERQGRQGGEAPTDDGEVTP